MYKRKARVVFVSRQGRAAAPLAARYARKHGSDWLEARAAALTPDQGPGSAVETLDAALLAWADLLVIFEPTIADALPARPATTRVKLWPLELDPETTGAALAAEIERRVQGMIGGMRMLSRVDEDD